MPKRAIKKDTVAVPLSNTRRAERQVNYYRDVLSEQFVQLNSLLKGGELLDWWVKRVVRVMRVV